MKLNINLKCNDNSILEVIGASFWPNESNRKIIIKNKLIVSFVYGVFVGLLIVGYTKFIKKEQTNETSTQTEEALKQAVVSA